MATQLMGVPAGRLFVVGGAGAEWRCVEFEVVECAWGVWGVMMSVIA